MVLSLTTSAGSTHHSGAENSETTQFRPTGFAESVIRMNEPTEAEIERLAKLSSILERPPGSCKAYLSCEQERRTHRIQCKRSARAGSGLCGFHEWLETPLGANPRSAIGSKWR